MPPMSHLAILEVIMAETLLSTFCLKQVGFLATLALRRSMSAGIVDISGKAKMWFAYQIMLYNNKRINLKQ